MRPGSWDQLCSLSKDYARSARQGRGEGDRNFFYDNSGSRLGPRPRGCLLLLLFFRHEEHPAHSLRNLSARTSALLPSGLISFPSSIQTCALYTLQSRLVPGRDRTRFTAAIDEEAFVRQPTCGGQDTPIFSGYLDTAAAAAAPRTGAHAVAAHSRAKQQRAPPPARRSSLLSFPNTALTTQKVPRIIHKNGQR